MQATFAGGLAEHLQAAGGVNAGIASSLRESIGQAHSVANTLLQEMRHGYDSLMELARTEMKGRIKSPKEAQDQNGDHLKVWSLHVHLM